MNVFDQSITLFVNQYAGRSWLFDSFVVFLSDQDFLKGGFALSLFWYAWFRSGEGHPQDRQRLLAMLAACAMALTLGQVLQILLPFRRRPIHTPELGFMLPFGLHPKTADGWSSLPSDHAMLFFAVSTGLFLVSRPLGLLSFFHTTVIVCLPRLYLGLHFTTDLIAGALVGIASSYLLCARECASSLTHAVLAWGQRIPALLYPALFLVTLEFANLFDDLRAIGVFSLKVLRAVFGR